MSAQHRVVERPFSPETRALRSSGGRIRTRARGAGDVVLTLGMVVLLFAFYLLYFSDWISAAKQREATAELDKQWRNPRATLDRPLHGDGIAKLSVPVFGPDFV